MSLVIVSCCFFYFFSWTCMSSYYLISTRRLWTSNFFFSSMRASFCSFSIWYYTTRLSSSLSCSLDFLTVSAILFMKPEILSSLAFHSCCLLISYYSINLLYSSMVLFSASLSRSFSNYSLILACSFSWITLRACSRSSRRLEILVSFSSSISRLSLSTNSSSL